MPAHCSQVSIGQKKLGNGVALTELDLIGNAFVDELAKKAAKRDRLPPTQRDAVGSCGELVTAVASWIGRATQLANRFPDPRIVGAGGQRWLRDSSCHGGAQRGAARLFRQQPQNRRQQRAASASSHVKSEVHPLGPLASTQQLEALRKRVQDKESREQPGGANAPGVRSLLVQPIALSCEVDRQTELCHKPKRQRSSKLRYEAVRPQSLPAYRNKLTLEPGGAERGSVQACHAQQGRSSGRIAAPVAQTDRETEATHVDLEVVLQDLQDLQTSGCRVSLPRPLQKRPAEPLSEACQRRSVPAASSEHRLLPHDRTQAALEEELEELERSGLKVRRR